MRIPQVTDRMKEAPAQVLRAVFGGIGQLLLIADRIKNREQEREPEPGLGAAAVAEVKVPASKPAPAAAVSYETRWRSLDKTGNVRLLGAEELAGGQGSLGGQGGPHETADRGRPPETAAAGRGRPAETAAAAPVTAMPWPNYDDLSVASLRARMRGLDPAQLRVLIEHEQASANRENVVTMFERRIAKLELGED